ncbi:MAG TPA: hypothetical protein VHA70_06985 [Bauldia sp.]|nr:hypothetical protein [Bauldia sp.]
MTSRRRGKRDLRRLVAFISALAFTAGAAVAQSSGAASDTTARDNTIIVATLVRTTLVALDQANVTGNYTVFRELASPSFRDRNSDANLALIFAPLRRAGIDLSAVVVLEPKLTEPPSIDQSQMLHIEGTFPTKPSAVHFELLYQAIDGQWRLFGVSVNPVAPAAKPPGGATPAPPASLVPPVPRPRPTP